MIQSEGQAGARISMGRLRTIIRAELLEWFDDPRVTDGSLLESEASTLAAQIVDRVASEVGAERQEETR